MFRRISAFVLIAALCLTAAVFGAAAAEKMSVKRIEAEAFSGDESLSTITLDEDLTYIGSQAFKGCTGLLTVYCFSPNVQIADDAFDGVTDAVVYCDVNSTMDSFAHKKGLTVKYLNAFETECDTDDDEACVLLPITWSVVNAMPGRNVSSTFTYEVYRNEETEPVYTSGATSSTSFSYTPTTQGDYYVDITMKNSLTETKLASKKVNVKDKLTMGTLNGAKIEWTVLAIDGNKALVITTNILKNESYFNPYWIKYKYTYWSGSYIGTVSTNYRGSQPEDPSRLITGISTNHIPLANGSWGTESDLFKVHSRYWCNNTFYNSAFTAKEKDRIIRVTNTNPNNPNSGIKGGPDSKDYVFFLSYEEMQKYMTTAASKKCGMTSAARSELNGNSDYLWWLRSPGKYRVNAMYVSGKTGTVSWNGSDVGHKLGYRPCMWIRIGK